MKKTLLLLFTALLGGVNVANAEEVNLGFAVDQYPWRYSTTGTRTTTISGEITVTGNNSYGEYKLTNKSLDMTVYKGYEIEYDNYTLNSDGIGFQIKIEGDPSSLNGYPQFDASSTTLSGDFKGTTGTITTFNLQVQDGGEGAKIVIKKVTWIKHDGTTEEAIYGGTAWGVNVTGEQTTVYPSPLPMSITYSGQYGGLEIIGEDGSHQAYVNDGENTEVYDYVIKFEEATTGPLMIELDDDAGGFSWLNYDAGVTEIKFTISPETCVQRTGEGDAATFTAKNLAKIYMKAPSPSDDVYPYTIKIASITREAYAPITFPDGKTLISYSPSSDVQLDVTDVDGLTAYVVQEVTATSVKLTETKGIYGANLGYILEGTAGATYNIPVVDDAPGSGGNKLSGTGDGAETVSANNVYVLSDGKFCLFTDTEIPAHKAYLPAGYVPEGAHELTLVFGDDDATAIKNIKVGTEDNVYYDLQGRRVLYPTKGLYIVNGKKVVIK